MHHLIDEIMTTAVAAVITARQQAGGYADPTHDTPGLLLLIDECQEVFAGNLRATRLAERIVAEGGPVGVGMVVTTRGIDLAYFGGSAALRAGLAGGNQAVFDPDLLDQLDQLNGGE
jgi:hypothetical protein